MAQKELSIILRTKDLGSRNVQKFNNELERVSRTTNKTSSKLKLAERVTNKFSKTSQAQFSKVERSVIKLRRSIGSLPATTKSAEQSITKLGHRLKTIGTIAGVAGATAVTASVIIGASFENEMKRVQALTGATGKQFDELSKSARRLGATTAFSAKEAADGMTSLAQLGVKVNEIGRVNEQVLKLAGSQMIELGRASEITAVTLNQFGLSAKDAKGVVDVFAQTAVSSAATVERLANGMVQFGGVARQFGISVKDASVILAQLNNMGFQGEQAGTALRNAFSRLSKLTPAATKALKKLGISTQQVNLENHSFAQILDTLKPLLNDTSAAVNIFGQRAFVPMLGLIREGSKGFIELKTRINNAKTATEQYEKIMESTANKFKIFKSVLSELAITIFGKIQPALNTILNITSKIISNISILTNTLSTNTRQWIESIGIVLSAGTAFIGLAVALRGVGLAIKVAGFTGLASPLGVIIGLIGVLTVGVIKMILKFIEARGGIKKFGIIAVENFKNIIESIKLFAVTFINVMSIIPKTAIDSMKRIIPILKNLGTLFIGLFTFDKSAILNSLKNITSSMKDIFIGNFVNEIIKTKKIINGDIVKFRIKIAVNKIQADKAIQDLNKKQITEAKKTNQEIQKINKPITSINNKTDDTANRLSLDNFIAFGKAKVKLNQITQKQMLSAVILKINEELKVAKKDSLERLQLIIKQREFLKRFNNIDLKEAKIRNNKILNILSERVKTGILKESDFIRKKLILNNQEILLIKNNSLKRNRLIEQRIQLESKLEKTLLSEKLQNIRIEENAQITKAKNIGLSELSLLDIQIKAEEKRSELFTKSPIKQIESQNKIKELQSKKVDILGGQVKEKIGGVSTGTGISEDVIGEATRKQAEALAIKEKLGNDEIAITQKQNEILAKLHNERSKFIIRNIKKVSDISIQLAERFGQALIRGEKQKGKILKILAIKEGAEILAVFLETQAKKLAARAAVDIFDPARAALVPAEIATALALGVGAGAIRATANAKVGKLQQQVDNANKQTEINNTGSSTGVGSISTGTGFTQSGSELAGTDRTVRFQPTINVNIGLSSATREEAQKMAKVIDESLARLIQTGGLQHHSGLV